MNTTLKIVSFFLVIILLFSQNTALAQDNYQYHTIKKGESLWSITKKYDITVDDILSVNPNMVKNQIKANHRIRIPVKASEITSEKTKYHIVKKGETLYSIAQKYDCTVKELRRSNDNKSILSIGDKIMLPKIRTNIDIIRKKHIVRKGETLYKISKKYGIPVKKIKEYNGLNSDNLSIGQTIYLSNKVKTVIAETDNEDNKEEANDSDDEDKKPTTGTGDDHIFDNDDIVISDEGDTVKEIREEGFAMLIESNIPSKKYTALHKTAKRNTLIKVKNKMNKKWIYIRVIGNIPDDGSTDDNVLIKISPAAFKKLGGVDKKFPVSIHYLN